MVEFDELISQYFLIDKIVTVGTVKFPLLFCVFIIKKHSYSDVEMSVFSQIILLTSAPLSGHLLSF